MGTENNKDKNLKISVRLANRSYPLIMSKEEKELIVGIEKDLNEQIRQIQTSYENTDLQDCLAMILLEKSLESKLNENGKESIDVKMLKDLNQKIEDVL